MGTLSEISDMLQGWLPALVVILVTSLARLASRGALAFLGRRSGFTLIARLAPQAANLILLFGMKLAVALTPLPVKSASWIESGIYVVGVFLVLGLIRQAALILLEWASLHAPHGSSTLQEGFIPLIRNLITLFVVLAGGIMILKNFGYDVMSLLAALGVGSLAVGLAAQPTLSNMISGFMLIIDRNLKPGDRITLAGQTGDVEEIGLRSTRIRTGNGKTLIVPNSELVNTRILNLSVPARSAAVSVQIRLDHDASFSRFRELCLEILPTVPHVLAQRGYGANLSTLNELGQSATVFFWVDDQDNEGPTTSELQQRLLERMGQEGLRIARLAR